MKLITVAGPPSSGKTSVILNMIKDFQSKNLKCAVIKFDCLNTNDDEIYSQNGIIVKVGLAGNLCPDHYFVSNIHECIEWGKENNLDILISESAGLCNRCSPHIEGIKAVCVIDNLMGVNTPKKIGPMLKMADIVVITKGDIVSQAEREIFALRVRQSNPTGIIMNINGITGQGAVELSSLLIEELAEDFVKGKVLRFSLPNALCSYCLGETRIGNEFQMGNMKKIDLT